MYSNDKTNQPDKKKLSPAILLTTLAALLILLAVFFSNNKTINKFPSISSEADKINENNEAINTNLLLHKQFSKLQRLDEEFNLSMLNNEPSSVTDSLNNVINTEEKKFAATIDSIKKGSQKYNAWANVVMLDSITNTFTKALSNRTYIADIRGSLKNKAPIAPVPLPLPAFQNVIVKENTEELIQLKVQLDEEEKRSTELLDIINDLKAENKKLSNDVGASAKKDDDRPDAAMLAAKKKVQQLQNEISDLNAELSFARIDCNLSRADAKKIISNSKQRMGLLEDALKNINVLTRSENEWVQRRAKEKLVELNGIASTVRD